MSWNDKHPDIKKLALTMLGHKKEPEDGVCFCCGAKGLTVASFRDELSLKEYGISRMCQECQDSVFEEPEAL